MDVKRNIFSKCSSFSRDKSGQLTVFMIIGILILFTFAGIFYVTNLTVEETFTAEGEIVVSAVPKTFEPIQEFTENCINSIAKNGLVLIGEQGGYIYPETVGEFSETDMTNYDGVSLGSVNVPYWHYNIQPNDNNVVVYSSHKPELVTVEDPVMSIEGQLESYLEENIDSCLQEFSAFSGQGFEIDYVSGVENKDATVKISDYHIGFWLNTKVVAEKEGAEQEISQFYVKVPLNLKHFFDVAGLITDTEKRTNFLERQGMELISVYGHKDNSYLAPVSDLGYDLYSLHYWDEGSLKQKIKGLLTSYVPLLRYLGSENFHQPVMYKTNLMAQKSLDNMVLPLFGADDLGINFDYFAWEPYFKVNSDESGAVKPEHIFIKYGVLNYGQQRYETHYSVSYPVLVTLRDDDAFGGEGYNFVFALESNIRNNEPAIANEIMKPYPKKISSLSCNEEHRSTELVKSIVVDSFTKEPIELVNIGFSIPEQADCGIGQTDTKGVVEEKYPAAYGGVVNLVHPEYLSEFYPLNTYKNKDHPLLIGYAVSGLVDYDKVLEMHKKKTINVRVKKKNLQKCVTPLICSGLNLGIYKDISCESKDPVCFFNGGASSFLGEPVIEFKVNDSNAELNSYYFSNAEEELVPEEEVLLDLTRISGFNDMLVSESFSKMITLKSNLSQPVELVPGIYKVTAITTYNKPVKIPTEKRCNYYSILTYDVEDCYTLNETIMDKFVTGGLKWDTEVSYLEIRNGDLYTSENLTFYVLDQNMGSFPEYFKSAGVDVPGRVLEDLQVPSKIQNVSQIPYVRNALLPIFE